MSKAAFIFELSHSGYGKYLLLSLHELPVFAAFIGFWPKHGMLPQ